MPTESPCLAAASLPFAATSQPCAVLIWVTSHAWFDPFIIITALPAALAGIVGFLFFTHTTLSVPALMGAVMCMGVGTANSILVVSFAQEGLRHNGDPN